MAQPVDALVDELKALIGTESEAMATEVEKGAIRKFAEAIEDPNPLYRDESTARRSRYGGIIAPPTFLRSVRSPRLPLSPALEGTGVLDGGSEWEYFEPVRPGDTITAMARLTNVLHRRGRLGEMVFLIYETTYLNQLREKVATQRSTLIRYFRE